MIYTSTHTGKNIEINYPWDERSDFALDTLAYICNQDNSFINVNLIWNDRINI